MMFCNTMMKRTFVSLAAVFMALAATAAAGQVPINVVALDLTGTPLFGQASGPGDAVSETTFYYSFNVPAGTPAGTWSIWTAEDDPASHVDHTIELYDVNPDQIPPPTPLDTNSTCAVGDACTLDHYSNHARIDQSLSGGATEPTTYYVVLSFKEAPGARTFKIKVKAPDEVIPVPVKIIKKMPRGNIEGAYRWNTENGVFSFTVPAHGASPRKPRAAADSTSTCTRKI